MDQFSQRATIDDIREQREERKLTREMAESILSQYDHLSAMANDIARVVWAIRWPRSGYEPSFEISFGEEYRDGRRAISAGFYMHQSNDSFDFPFEYLFMDYNEIRTAEDIRADEEAAKAQAAATARANDQRSRDIATLKRLRQEYPDV